MIPNSPDDQNNVNAEECKRLMTQGIHEELNKLSADEKDYLKRKNAEALAKFTQ